MKYTLFFPVCLLINLCVYLPTVQAASIVERKPADSQAAGLARVRVHADTAHVFAGSSTLSREKFFNIHDSQFNPWLYSVDDVMYFREQLGVTPGRQFWGPMAQAKQLKQRYPSTKEAKALGQKSRQQMQANPLRKTYSNRSVITEHPKAVVTDKNDNMQEGARWAADYFEHFYDDATRPLFYEPMNEPFVHSGEFGVDPLHMSNWFKAIAKEFKSRPALASVNLIGYSAAWPSLELWDFSHWRKYQKLFMDDAGPYMDAFSVHFYDGTNIEGQENIRSGSNVQAILDLIETYSMHKWGVVKPHAITEYGGIIKTTSNKYNAITASQEIKSLNHILLELLNREDRILTSIPFITGHANWYWQSPDQGAGEPYSAALWRPNPALIKHDKQKNRFNFIDSKNPDNYLFTPKIAFFKLWAGVSGERIFVNSSDPDIQSVAYRKRDSLYVALSNLDSKQRQVDLALAGIKNSRSIVSSTVKRLKVSNEAASALEVESVKGNTLLSAGPLVLDPSETVLITHQLRKPIHNAFKSQRSVYYADNHVVNIQKNTPVVFNFKNVNVSTALPEKSHATLRISLARKHDKSKAGTILFNGNPLTMPDNWPGYDQQNRDDFYGSIEVPVALSQLKAKSALELQFPDSGGQVASVVLEVHLVERDQAKKQ